MTASTGTEQMPTSAPTTAKLPVEQPAQPELPKLSTADFQAYNKLAVMMEYYHNHFRHTWTTIYTACEKNKRPNGMSLSQFLSLAQNFIRQLTAHHTIEEIHIFPVLAQRMPEFRDSADMLTQHKGIHEGLDRLEAYIDGVRRGEWELRLNDNSNSKGGEGGGGQGQSLKGVLDSFGPVLWKHLDAEVKNLGAENMRRYWSKSEIAKFNW